MLRAMVRVYEVAAEGTRRGAMRETFVVRNRRREGFPDASGLGWPSWVEITVVE